MKDDPAAQMAAGSFLVRQSAPSAHDSVSSMEIDDLYYELVNITQALERLSEQLRKQHEASEQSMRMTETLLMEINTK